MKLYSISLIISILISMYFQILAYKRLLFNKKINLSFIGIFQLFIVFCLIVFNNCFDTDVLKAPIGFLLILLSNRIVFKDPYSISINTTTVSYAIVVVVEIILSIIFINVGQFDMAYLSKVEGLMLIFSFLSNFISYLVCSYIPFIRNFLHKINTLSSNLKYRKFLTVVFLFVLLIIDFKNIDSSSLLTYVVSLLMVILIFVIFISYLNDEYQIKNELEKVDILLNNISNYEKIIDDNRINSHEMLNNLILLKSVKDKNTKKFEKLLDDMIIMYDKNGNTIKNISLLPKGIKGIIYFKLNELENKGIDVTINISKRLSNSIELIDHDEYVILCKCISILLDNAIDACKNNENMKVLVDIFKEKNNIIVSIENTCSNENIQMESINTKYFSTKGKNRGLGLYIVNNLLSVSSIITLKQSYDKGYFVSKLIIQNKKD